MRSGSHCQQRQISAPAVYIQAIVNALMLIDGGRARWDVAEEEVIPEMQLVGECEL